MLRLPVIQFLLMSALLNSCGDSMGLKSPANQNLDAQIAVRLRLLSDSTSPKGIYARRIHQEIQKLTGSINLFDACRWEMAQANALFERQARDLGLDQGVFKNLDSLPTKAKVIVSIKQNELVLLNHILSQKKF